MYLWENFTKEQLEEMVKNSYTKKELGEKIGYTKSSYSKGVDALLNYYHFNIDHFIKLHNQNLVGQKFGLLTVIKKGESKNNKTVWVCNCGCGTKNYSVIQSNLKNGNTTSCGCKSKQTIRKIQGKDLTNQQIGYWKIIKLDETKSKNGSYWFAKCLLCNSGQIHSISASNLLSGKTLSCGCHKSSLNTILIENYFKQKNIKYIKEYSFSDLKGDTKKLLFDFAIFDNDKIIILIEYQGRQHYIANQSWGGETALKVQQKYDQKKRDYCRQKAIQLIEIPYCFSKEQILQTLEEIV